MLRRMFLFINLFFSMSLFAQDVKYDSQNGMVYVMDNGVKKTFLFRNENIGNTATWFDFFDNKPAIVRDSNSLASISSYTTLMYTKGDFYIDCIYVKFKSNSNGIYTKIGFCGLNKKIINTYDSIEQYVQTFPEKISENINLINTARLINGESKHLSIVSYRNKETTLLQLYKDKNSLLNGDYFYEINSNDQCSYFGDSPWLIYSDAKRNVFSLKVERKNKNGINLYLAVAKDSHGKCLDFKPSSISSEKAFIYRNGNKTKSYLIHGDTINYLYTDNSGMFCEIRYLNNKNTYITGAVPCSDIAF